jgi:hypothetical protein
VAGLAPAPLNSWDELLLAYVDGTLDSPAFALANSDAHDRAELDSRVGMAKNGLYVSEFTTDEINKAIEAGRSFATTGPSLAFDVNGEFVGDTAEIRRGAAKLNLSVNAEIPAAMLVKIDIIKNGQLWQTIEPNSQAAPSPSPARPAPIPLVEPPSAASPHPNHPLSRTAGNAKAPRTRYPGRFSVARIMSSIHPKEGLSLLRQPKTVAAAPPRPTR